MSLFYRYLDEKMPGDRTRSDPFTHKYFLPADAKPDKCGTSTIQIRQHSRHPPHYQLLIGNTIYDVYPNRNNLFYTIALFVFYVKVTSSGYIGNLYLGGKSIELLDAVEPGPIVDLSNLGKTKETILS